MNVFNRIAMSLILLGVIVAALVISLLPGTVMEFLRSTLDTGQGSLGSPIQFLGAVVGLLVAIGAFLLLIAELRPSKRNSVVVTQEATGTAELTNESVALRVRRAAEGVAEIRDVTPTIHSHGKTVEVLLRVTTDSDVDLQRKTQEVMQAVRAEVETKMGIPIKSLKVTIKHSGGGRRAASPDPEVSTKDSFRG